jgi:hypothetical protein
MSNPTVLFPVTDISMMTKAIAKSNLFGIKEESQVFALMLVAQAEGKHPATVAQEYDIIQGRPAIKSQSALARFQNAGGKIQWLKRSDLECEAEFSHPLSGTVVINWSIDRAKIAQLTGKDSWKKFPAQMLSARVVAEGVRACYPACLNGLYLSEEVRDFDDIKPERKIKAKGGVEIPVCDDIDPETGTGTYLVSENTNKLIKHIKACEIDFMRFQLFLQQRGKLSENQFLVTLDDDKAVKILENWEAANQAFNEWSLANENKGNE